MWQKGCAVLVGLLAVVGFGWVSAQEPSDGGVAGASYILKAGDCVTWPSGHAWYMRITSTSNYPFKVVTTNSSGRAIYAKATGSGAYALYAEGRLRVKGTAMVDSVRYNSPRSHKLTIGPESFLPAVTGAYVNSGADGAHLTTSSSGEMVAPIHLPDGATVTQVRVFFYDDSTSSLYFAICAFNLRDEGTVQMIHYETVGTPGYGSHLVTPTVNATIDNTSHYYFIGATSLNWDTPNLRIKGATLTYTVSEAP